MALANFLQDNNTQLQGSGNKKQQKNLSVKPTGGKKRNSQNLQVKRSQGQKKLSSNQKNNQNNLQVKPTSPSSSQLFGTRNPQQTTTHQNTQPTKSPQRNNDNPQDNNYNPQPNPRITQTTSRQSSQSGNTGSNTGGGTGLTAAEQQAQAQRRAEQEAEQAYWDDQMSQLQRLLESAKTQKGQSLDRLGRSVKRQRSRLNEDQSSAMSQLETNRQDTISDKQEAVNDVNQNARSTFSDLQQMLGAAGAGNSSASEIMAPHAVSQQASSQRGDVVDQFGRNMREIATSEEETESEYERALADLQEKRRQKEENLLRNFLQEQTDLNQQLSRAATRKAMAGGQNYQQARSAREPFQSRVSQQMDTLDQLFNRFRSPEVSVDPVQVSVPDLGDYAVDPIQLRPGERGNAPAGTLPYLPFLDEEESAVLGG